MKISNIEFGPYPLFLAPMEDVTDIGFRKLCKRYGADMMYTEFVAAEAIVRNIRSTMEKMKIDDDERPWHQIYGAPLTRWSRPQIVEQPIRHIDLNIGLPRETWQARRRAGCCATCH
jgi:tRNA-dihydrouridine synthase